MRKISMPVCIIMLSSCVSAYQDELVYQNNLNEMLQYATDETYGKPPEEGYKMYTEIVMKATLKDPESAKFIWGEPYRCTFHSKYSYTTPVLGWCVEFSYNAKNSFGGYVGYETRILHYLYGKLYNMCSEDPKYGLICG